jgi:putative endonuclease
MPQGVVQGEKVPMGKPKAVSTYQKGKRGEEHAAVYLRLKGYKILENNYRVGRGEIDLVACRSKILVFVEVKTRRGKAQGSPLEAVTPYKVKRLSDAAAFYLAQHPLGAKTCRFDVVTIGPEKNWLGLPKIQHFENAFSVSGSFNV